MIQVETSVTANPPRLLTIEEYVRLPADGRKTELVRGRIVEVPPTYPFHGYVCGRIYKAVEQFVEAGKLGRVMTNDSGVVTERDPDTLRGADVCYYSYKRLPAGPLPRDSYLTVMPELVFEVGSPSDRRSKVLAKVTEYLTAGVTVVCVVNPDAGTAVVYRDNQDPETFAADAELALPDVLPGFRVPLRQFFE
jgi:Uma2 family endonuclease